MEKTSFIYRVVVLSGFLILSLVLVPLNVLATILLTLIKLDIKVLIYDFPDGIHFMTFIVVDLLKGDTIEASIDRRKREIDSYSR